MVIWWAGVGGGAPFPWGRRHWICIDFATLKWNCSNNVKCRILFLIYAANPTTDSILFFFWERESTNISWRQKQENWKEKWKWQSCEKVVYMFFNHYINLWVFHDIRSSFRVQTCTWRNWNNPAKWLIVMLLFPREIQGIKWKNGNFLIWSQIIVLNLVCSMFLVNKGTIS